jgi:outer membrane protein assembly factor BamB
VVLFAGARFSIIKAVYLTLRRYTLQTPDPEFAAESENEVEITDLVSPTGTDKVQKRFAGRKKARLFRTRTWMSIAIIAGIALLVFTVLLNVSHVPKAARVIEQPVQINYPVSLSVVNGICYANAPNGVVTAFRVRDGVLIWRHVSRAKSEESATVVDGVVYLTPILPNGSHVTSMTVEALRARDGVSLWSRSLPTDSPATFQLTVVNKVVYVMSAAERIDALRASDGSLLWHYTSSVPFVSLPAVSDGMVYTSTQDGHFTALRASNGTPLWKYTSLVPPQQLPAVVAEGMVFLSLQDGSMDVLRADTGILRWRYRPHVPALQLFPPILVADGVVFAGTQDGHLYALRASDGFTIWSVVLHPIDNLFLMNVTGGVVFVAASFGGSVNAISQSTGSVIWQYPGKAEGSVPITVVQGVVYLAQYAIGANILLSITALRASDGILLWSYTPHTDYKQLLPIVGNDIVLIALQDGSVEALRASSGSLLWRRAMNS